MGLFGANADHPLDQTCYGYKIKWSPLHSTPAELHPLIYTYDKLSADALDHLDEVVPPAASGFPPRKDIQETYEPKEKKAHRDLYNLIKKHAEDDDKIGEFWTEVNTIPKWVDWAQIERGQKVFWRYGGPAITALTYMSLLGGMGGGRTVETLDRTGGFGAEVVKRRLLETTQHTLDVHKDLESIKPGGSGWESSVRVRLLHSAIRRRIVQLAKEKPEYYDLEKYGVPVNDLDCIGTINTFSATLVWMGFPRQGIFLRRQETLDFLALWRYVAYLMGTPHDWLATPEAAKAMLESLLVSEIKPTKKSGVLANNIITGFEGIPPIYASRGFLNAQTYWLNGSELAQELQIEKPSLYHMTLVAGQCWIFMVFAYINRSVPSWDERSIKFLRNGLYDALVDNKKKGALGYKAKFSFKWIPDLAFPGTPLGVPDQERSKKSGAFKHAGLERTALLALLFTAAGILASGWATVKVAKSVGLVDWLQRYSRIAVLIAIAKVKGI